MQKKLHLEMIRILALFCIVYDHTGPRGSSLYTFTDGQLTWMVSLISAVVCKVGVPLFFMVSGALFFFPIGFCIPIAACYSGIGRRLFAGFVFEKNPLVGKTVVR